MQYGIHEVQTAGYYLLPARARPKALGLRRSQGKILSLRNSRLLHPPVTSAGMEEKSSACYRPLAGYPSLFLGCLPLANSTALYHCSQTERTKYELCALDLWDVPLLWLFEPQWEEVGLYPFRGVSCACPTTEGRSQDQVINGLATTYW